MATLNNVLQCTIMGKNGQTSKAMSRGWNDKIKRNKGHFLTCLMALQRFPQVLWKVGLKSPPYEDASFYTILSKLWNELKINISSKFKHKLKSYLYFCCFILLNAYVITHYNGAQKSSSTCIWFTKISIPCSHQRTITTDQDVFLCHFVIGDWLVSDWLSTKEQIPVSLDVYVGALLNAM